MIEVDKETLTLPKWLFGLVLASMLSLCGMLLGLYTTRISDLDEKVQQHIGQAAHPVGASQIKNVEKSVDSLSSKLDAIMRNQMLICGKLNIECSK